MYFHCVVSAQLRRGSTHPALGWVPLRRVPDLGHAATTWAGAPLHVRGKTTPVSRRVVLAKSNVLRYFESREAVLLELLDDYLGRWLALPEDQSFVEGAQIRGAGGAAVWCWAARPALSRPARDARSSRPSCGARSS